MVTFATRACARENQKPETRNQKKFAVLRSIGANRLLPPARSQRRVPFCFCFLLSGFWFQLHRFAFLISETRMAVS